MVRTKNNDIKILRKVRNEDKQKKNETQKRKDKENENS